MTEPTNKELDAVITHYRTRIYPQDMQPHFERAIMRAVLAKWGTPQPTQPQAEATPHCPDCGTHEVSIHKVCHNSACSKYGAEVTVHKGWKTPPKAQPATACKQRPIAYVDGDDAVRRILWEPNQAAFDIAVGTKLYAYQSPADAVDAERYRWLRRWKGQEHEPPFTVQHEIDGTLWGGDLDAAIDAERASRGPAPAQAAPAAVAGSSEFPHEKMDAVALGRYKVVSSDQSMFYRFAVVAGDGAQQLYIGREVDCQNMARKFAGAFLDGAFAYHSMTAAPTTQPTPQQEAQEPSPTAGMSIAQRILHVGGRNNAAGYVEFGSTQAVEALVKHVLRDLHPSPAAQGDALPREDFAWLVVQEACETEPADEDDPECVRILRRDLKSSVLAAFLRLDAARAAQEGKSCPKE